MEAPVSDFTNGEITVSFKPAKCIHAEKCAQGLSEVFRTSVIPWIDMDAASTKDIIAQVRKCPSGALDYCYNENNVAVKKSLISY